MDNYLSAVQGIGISITLISLSVLGENISFFHLSLSLQHSLDKGFGGQNIFKQIWIYMVGPFLGSA